MNFRLRTYFSVSWGIRLSMDGLESWARFELPRLWKSGFRIPENFARGIRNPGLWNAEYSSSNPEFYQRLELRSPESKFHWEKWNQVPGIGNSRCGIQNPGLSWIPLHGQILMLYFVSLRNNLDSRNCLADLPQWRSKQQTNWRPCSILRRGY